MIFHNFVTSTKLLLNIFPFSNFFIYSGLRLSTLLVKERASGGQPDEEFNVLLLLSFPKNELNFLDRESLFFLPNVQSSFLLTVWNIHSAQASLVFHKPFCEIVISVTLN